MAVCELGGIGGAPGELRALRRELTVGDHARFAAAFERDPRWSSETLADVLYGGGFVPTATGPDGIADAEMIESIADTVADDMRILVVGLNPSPTAAASGVGFAHPSNRFWPAALAAGCASADRDPEGALVDHGMGMTDLVKRTTARASEVDRTEFVAGIGRLERLVERHRPGVTCIVGVTGWRMARDRRAVEGEQPNLFGGRPLHVIGNPSGLNAHQSVQRCAQQLRAALESAGS